MKKTYIYPEILVTLVEAEQMIANSITKVGGDAGLTIGEGDAPEEADVKQQRINSVEWENWEDQQQ